MLNKYNRINVFDDFFDLDDFFKIKVYQECSHYRESYQPYSANYTNRLKGYPVWESLIDKNHPIYEILLKTIELKLSKEYEIDSIILRKIYVDELLRSPYKGRSYGMIHKDKVKEVKMSGVIYLNGGSINDGTSLFSEEMQMEPDIIIGSKANRCVIYNSDIPHAPGIDWEEKVRNILVFFLKGK
jgi:hypothetical protein